MMRSGKWGHGLVIALGIGCLSCGLLGCGETPVAKGKAKPTDGAKAAAAGNSVGGVEELQVIEPLPELEDPLPPLDDGRVTLAAPKGWFAQPRNKRYLALFIEKKGVSYPQLMLLVEDTDRSDLTDENLLARRNELAAEYKTEDISATKMGGRTALFSRRNMPGSSGNDLEILSVVTVLNGRRYALEMRAPLDADGYLSFLLASARGIQFPGAGDAPASAEAAPSGAAD